MGACFSLCYYIILFSFMTVSSAWCPPTRFSIREHVPRQTIFTTRLQSTLSSPSTANTTYSFETTDAVPQSAIPPLDAPLVSPLGLTLSELAAVVGGTGRAKLLWAFYRQGLCPLALAKEYNSVTTSLEELYHQRPNATTTSVGGKLQQLLQSTFHGTLEETVGRIAHVSVSRDGTTKLLIQLAQDGLQVETVLLPWSDRQSSTLCVSSQVGCRQACTFCLTGRMGKLRSLTTDEILLQVFLATRICRERTIYPIDNIVFMGMGEPADNAPHVVKAVHILTHAHQYALAPRRITVSTVAPTPHAFHHLAQAPCALAWSVHASRDSIRRQLVPTTQYSMVTLREGLIQALLQRSRRLRATMLEVTLIHSINDSLEDAEHLADFCQPLLQQVPGIKLVINLIPWNNIAAVSGPASRYKAPSMAQVSMYQQTLIDKGLLCYVRTTRGDDESAACGQLATSKKPVDMVQ
jgi:23S rRNA (adenine2503-C2)-methyltransferase